MNYKQIALISLFIATSIGIAFALYFFFFRPITQLPGTQPTPTTPGQLPSSEDATSFDTIPDDSEFPTFDPFEDESDEDFEPPVSQEEPFAQNVIDFTPPEVASGGITKVQPVSTTLTKALTVSPSGNGINFYDQDVGRFFKIDNNGTKIALSDQQFFNVETVTWAPDSTKAVIEYPDGFNVVYDFETKKQVTLPSHWEQFEFSPNNQKLSAISLGLHRDQNWLITVNSDGTGAKAIEPLGDNAHKVISAWNPDEQIVAFSKTGDPVGGEANEIYLIGQNNENFKSIIVDGYGFIPKWSPDGKQLLYSTYSSFNAYRPLLWVVDAQGSRIGANRRELGITTWADKCTFADENSIICAIPQQLPENAGFARAIADFIPDMFFKINTISGFRTPLAIPDTPVNASELTITKDGQYLYYKNNLSGGAERIRLK